MSEQLKESLGLLSGLLGSVPNLIDDAVQQYVSKYGNEDLARKYVNLIIAGKNKEANKILKKLQNGE